MNKIEKLKELIEQANYHRDLYYNKGDNEISDEEYDELFDKITKLEEETGVIFSNSPTQTVGYNVVSELPKVKHNHPMLSLGKTKDINEISAFLGGRKGVCMSKLDGCFPGSARVLMADNTTKLISRIQPGELVKTFNPETLQIESSRVLKVFHNGRKPRDLWCELYTSNRCEKIECTKNHRIFTSEGYKEAGDIKNGDYIYKYNQNKINDTQKSIILGTLLGDGHFVQRHNNEHPGLEIHTSKTIHDNYDDIIDKISQCFISYQPKISYRTSGYSTVKNNMKDVNLHSIICPPYMSKKANQLRCGLTFTEDICNHLTPLALAILYIDDGSKTATTEESKTSVNKLSSCMIHTNRHPKENVEYFVSWLNQHGISCKMRQSKTEKGTNRPTYIVFIDCRGTKVFWDIISPYIPKTIRAKKLGPSWQDVPEIKWWEDNRVSPGLDLYPFDHSHTSRAFYDGCLSKNSYDLEVEGNHNYFVNNYAVHNCTASIRYMDGKLVSAETRGDGAIGENVTHNASAISNIPLTISEKGEVVVDGELIVPLDEFERINSELPEEDRYKSARNLASGSIRQLDSSVARSRKIKFIAWKLIKSAKNCENSFIKEWFYLDELGFDVVPMIELPENLPVDRLEDAVELIKAASAEYKYKIDGCVFGFDDLEYAKSLGKTEHHFNGQLAFKFYDEKYPSVLRDVIWQVGRTGVLSPVAVFDPVDIDGATITRATLHNPAYIQLLGLEIGCTVNIIKANDVIPRVDSCEKGITGITIEYPKICPACGHEVHFVQSDSGKMNLMCKNSECPAKQVAKFTHFVSRDCANIDGLSEATLEKLLSLHLIRSYTDIYHLNRYKNEVSALDGFGEKSWENLWNAIEKSRHIVLSKFINALSIPLIGKKASKSLSKYCKGSIDTFKNVINHPETLLDIEDFGPAMVQSITDFNFAEARVLSREFVFDNEFAEEVGTTLDSKTFCVTGSLEHFTRKSIEEKIESLGGKMASSVTSKTDYLVTNTPDSGSSKNKKAQELGINIITEEEFLTMIGE